MQTGNITDTQTSLSYNDQWFVKDVWHTSLCGPRLTNMAADSCYMAVSGLHGYSKIAADPAAWCYVFWLDFAPLSYSLCCLLSAPQISAVVTVSITQLSAF